MTFKVPEEYRVRSGPLATDWTYGRNGCFMFPSVILNRMISVAIAANVARKSVAGVNRWDWS